MPQLNTPKRSPRRTFNATVGPALTCSCPAFIGWKDGTRHSVLLSCTHIIDKVRNEEERPLEPDMHDVALLRFDERQRAALLCTTSEVFPALMVIPVMTGLADDLGFMRVTLPALKEGVMGTTVGYVKANTSRLELGSIVGPYLVAMGAETKCPNCDRLPIYESNLTGLLYRASFMYYKPNCPDCYDDTVPF